MADNFPLEPARPQPVLNAAQIASAVVAVVGAIGTVLVVCGVVTPDDVSTAQNAVTGVVVAVVTLVGVVLPIWQALKARELVTPLKDPVDTDGMPLQRADTLLPPQD